MIVKALPRLVNYGVYSSRGKPNFFPLEGKIPLKAKSKITLPSKMMVATFGQRPATFHLNIRGNEESTYFELPCRKLFRVTSYTDRPQQRSPTVVSTRLKERQAIEISRELIKENKRPGVLENDCFCDKCIDTIYLLSFCKHHCSLHAVLKFLRRFNRKIEIIIPRSYTCPFCEESHSRQQPIRKSSIRSFGSRMIQECQLDRAKQHGFTKVVNYREFYGSEYMNPGALTHARLSSFDFVDVSPPAWDTVAIDDNATAATYIDLNTVVYNTAGTYEIGTAGTTTNTNNVVIREGGEGGYDDDEDWDGN